MRKSVLVAMLRLAGLVLLACILSVQAPPALAQSGTENIVASLHGSGDDVFPITGVSGFLVARIHGNPESLYFAVKTYDRFGNLASLLVNTTDRYIGIVPFNFDAYKMHDLDGGLIEVSAQGNWSIEIIELYSLAQVQNTQALGGYGDYVGYVKGSSLIASVYGNEELRYFSVHAIGMNGNRGQGDLLVNTTSLYEGTVRLPSNKDGIVFIVQVPGAWAISLNTSDLDDLFDTRIVTFKSNPYSPFKDILDKPTATPSPAPTAKKANAVTSSSATETHSGKVNRDANLRAGPGTSYAIVGAAKAGQQIMIVASNAANDWYQLDTGQWIAAFLVKDITTDVPTVAEGATVATPALIMGTPTAKTTATAILTTATPVPPTSTPTQVKTIYWADAGVQTCGNFEWRVSDVRRSKDAWYYDRHQVAQGEYLIIYAEVKNLGGSNTLFWDVNPSMPGKTISERGSQYAAWMMTGGFNTMWSNIEPGKILTLVGAFDVAPDTHTYLFGALSCEQVVSIGSWFELERGAIKASN